MRTVGALILAAGASSRLGRPKQLISYQGETLIARAVRIAGEGGCAPVAVVLGSAGDEIAAQLNGSPVLIVQNNDWERGLGTSVRAGVLAILNSHPDLDAAVLLACDQPCLTASTIVALIEEQQQSGKSIVASRYAGTLGIPALFDRTVFGDLLALPDDSGAKRLIEAHGADVAEIAFADGALDIDTPADHEKLFCRD